MAFIVVGVDGSATAQKALAVAVEQARIANAGVRAVNVVILPAMSGYEFGPVDLHAMQTAAEETIGTAIDRLRAEYGGRLPVSISSEVKVGHVGAELVHAAEAEGGAAMIVAGSRGFGGLKSMLLGSTTTYLAHHLPCPLLIIPSEES